MRFLLLFVLSVLLTSSVVAQNLNVSGTVLDETQSPMAGVNVVVKGSTIGVITDVNGSYTISAPSDGSLVFSFIGMGDLEEKINGRGRIDVSLSATSNQIDEVVVVGYGTQKRATLTGSVATVGGDELVKRSVVSTSTMLQGTMPGVTVQQTSGEPGADGSSIRIRGSGSINAGENPLVLVDGMEMDLDKVDPNTIESISTLKDAASASIYGSRAANGVILVTTKRGKEGKVQVSYKGTVTTQSPTNMPERLSIADNMRYTNQAAINANAGSLPYSEETIEYYSNYKGDNWTRHETDWFNEVVKSQALLTDHTVNVMGGNDKVRFSAVGNYTYQDGLVRTNNYERYSLRINTDAQIFKWMRLSLDANMLESKRTQPSISTARSLISKALYFEGQLPGINADGTWGEGKNYDNPIAASYEGGASVTKTPDVVINSQLFITPIEGMEIVGQYSRRMVNTDVNNFTRGYEVYQQGTFLAYSHNKTLTKSHAETVRNYYRIQGSYNTIFDEKHNVKLLAGFQAEDNTNQSFSVSRGGFDIPGYEYLSNGTGDPTATGGMSDWSLVSFFGRLNYDFEEKYLFEVSARGDASSRFARNHRWGAFPSASAGWIFTKESFLEDAKDILNMGKLRFSWGMLGNQNLNSNYPTYAQVLPGYSYWHNSELNPGVAITTMSNPDITWEKSTQYNVGLDLGFFGNKLTFNGDFYVKNVTDMIMKFPSPYYIGMQSAYTNAASMHNIGWELAVTYKGRIGKDFNYAASLTLDDSRNKVLDLKGQTYQDLSIVEGYPVNGHWGFITDGYFQNTDDIANSPHFDNVPARLGDVKYVDQDGDGVITQDDRVFLGDPFPHYNFGIKLYAEYKGIDLNIFIQGVGEQAKYMSGIGVSPFLNGAALFAHQTDTWSPENPNAAYPILLPVNNNQRNYDKSDKFVRSGAYARLKNVELGYRLPTELTKKAKLSYVRCFVSGQNLLTFSNYVKGFDPEASVDGTNGGEFYPIMRTFTFGLDIRF